MRRSIIRNCLLLALAGPVLAAVVLSPATAQTEREAAELDALFDQLKVAPDEDAARAITNKIWIYWTTPADPHLASRMQMVLLLRQEANFPGAIALLDEIIADYPSYAEGWNQRATLHFTMGNYQKSVSDIEKVLDLEPRHFGAIAGLAGILTERGSKDAALKAWERYLEVFPADREAQEIVAKLSEELAGQRT